MNNINSLTGSRFWYALYTRSRHENHVHSQLVKKSIESFYPTKRVLSKRRDRRKMIEAPLFPGYLFVRTTPKSSEHLSILKTPGAVTIVGNSSGSIPVPDDCIANLNNLSGKEGLDAGPCFHKGDRVLVVSGPFAGTTGIFSQVEGNSIVAINIEVMNQAAILKTSLADVEFIDSLRDAG